MQFESIRLKGIGPFKEEYNLDLSEVPGPLVAIVGPNGSGKSTLLEAFAGAMHRTTPTRGRLNDLATERNAFVEATVINGHRYTLRQTVDSVSGKGEAVVTDENGASVLASGKLKEFDTWAATHLPSPDVLFSSVFAAQGSAGFLGLKPAERKSVLLKVLGISRLEALAEEARGHQRESQQEVRVLEARLADAQGEDVEVCEVALAEARDGVERHAVELDRVREALSEAGREAAQVEAAHEERRRVLGEVSRLTKQREDTAVAAEQLGARLKNNLELRDEADAIRAGVAKLADVEEEFKGACDDLADLAEQDRRARWEVKGARQRREGALERIRWAEKQLEGADELRALAEQESEFSEAVDRAEAEKALRQTELEELRRVQLADAGDRIEALRSGLVEISNGIDDSVEVACDCLFHDDQAKTAAEELPGKLEDANLAVAEARRASIEAGEALGAAMHAGRRLEELTEVEKQLQAAIAERDETDATIDAAKAQQVDPKELERARSWIARLEASRTECQPLAAKAEHLSRAEARIEELTERIDVLNADLASLDDQLDALVVPPEPPEPPDLNPLRAAVTSSEASERTARAEVTRAEERLRRATEAQEKAEALQMELDAAHAELADWTRLAADLGRDGLQAMEIDAAGPELTELANDLLHHCHGSRWTVSIETQRLSADGKRTLEGCEVRVLDSDRGRDAAAETLSGGEKVLVGEAVALALSMLACRRAGVEAPTLIRDESGAALDGDNARAYVRMLRRAAEVTGASKVLFVSHSTEVQEMADERVEVGRLPPPDPKRLRNAS